MMKKHVPVLAKWFIEKCIDDAYNEEFLGDLQEAFEERLERKGKFYAACMCWVDTFHLLFGFSSLNVFKNHPLRSTFFLMGYIFRMAFRNLLKSRHFTVINIAGLTFALICSLLISLWVRDEVRVDKFHAHGDTIYRVLGDVDNNGESLVRQYIPSAMVQPMLESFPEIAAITRVSQGDAVFEAGNAKFSESGIYADSSVLQIFSFPLKEGKQENILSDAQSVVISEKLAQKYFPGESALGKSISIVEKEKLNYVVTGVLEPIPSQSSLQFDFIIAYDQFETKFRPWWNGKNNQHAYTNFNIESYVSVHAGADIQQLNKKLETFIHDYTGMETTDALFVYPFTEFYLHDDFSAGRIPTGKIQYVKLLAVIAMIVLVIACINFMNLSTARASARMKEIGVRKMIGAPRLQLLIQFIAESLMIACVSMVLAISIAHLLLPFFNMLTQKQIEIPLHHPEFIFMIAGIALITGLLAGLYPAVYLSAFTPTKVLKGSHSFKGALSGFRSGLVVVQFAISIIFIVFTMVVSDQLNFLQNTNLGIRKENILEHPLHGIQKNKEAYRNELLTIPGVQAVGFSEHSPLSVSNSNLGVSWKGMPEHEEIYFNVMQVGVGMDETFDFQISEGVGFSNVNAADSLKYVIVNEAAVQAMQIENPIGMQIRVWGFDSKVIGVVKDFHHQSMMHAIEPVVLLYNPEEVFTAFISMEDQHASATILQVLDVYEKFEQAYPFHYAFVEDEYNASYRDVATVGMLSKLFSIVAIFISCLGLFGLSTFIAAQRTKETGIRKVLGASSLSLLGLFSGTFIKRVVIAFVLAAPVAWWYSDYWLSGYAYRIELGILPFAWAGLLAILVALLTVGYNTIKTANANPVDSLRYE